MARAQRDALARACSERTDAELRRRGNEEPARRQRELLQWLIAITRNNFDLEEGRC